jgi:hypothetical protein
MKQTDEQVQKKIIDAMPYYTWVTYNSIAFLTNLEYKTVLRHLRLMMIQKRRTIFEDTKTKKFLKAVPLQGNFDQNRLAAAQILMMAKGMPRSINEMYLVISPIVHGIRKNTFYKIARILIAKELLVADGGRKGHDIYILNDSDRDKMKEVVSAINDLLKG